MRTLGDSSVLEDIYHLSLHPRVWGTQLLRDKSVQPHTVQTQHSVQETCRRNLPGGKFVGNFTAEI